MSSGLRAILPPDEAAAILCHSFERDFGRAFAGYAAYVRHPKKDNIAFVMHARNAAETTINHNRFTANVLTGREIVIPSTTLPSAFENPGIVMRAHSRFVGNHICFNLNPNKDSPLVLQTVFNWSAAGMPDVATVALRMQAPEWIEAMDAAARGFPESDAACLAKTPATPTHYLFHYDMTKSSRIRDVSDNVMHDIAEYMANRAAIIARAYGGDLRRVEGDGGWILKSIPQHDVVHNTKIVRVECIEPMAKELVEAFDDVKRRYANVQAVTASQLNVFAQPGYLQPVVINGEVCDYDGDVFARIRFMAKQPQRGPMNKPAVHITDMPHLFAA